MPARALRVTAGRSHPNICTIHDVGTDPPFIAMELLDGEIPCPEQVRAQPLDARTDVFSFGQSSMKWLPDPVRNRWAGFD
jgi:hypothetical protein